jgi:hypothetical protein
MITLSLGFYPMEPLAQKWILCPFLGRQRPEILKRPYLETLETNQPTLTWHIFVCCSGAFHSVSVYCFPWSVSMFVLDQFRVHFHKAVRLVVTYTDVIGWQLFSLSWAFWLSSWYFRGWVVCLLQMTQVLIPSRIPIFELLSRMNKTIFTLLVVCMVLYDEGSEDFVHECIFNSVAYS